MLFNRVNRKCQLKTILAICFNVLVGIVLFELVANKYYASDGRMIVPRSRIYFIPDEDLSYILKPGLDVSAENNPFFPGVAEWTNSLGLRDVDAKEWHEKRILVLGDSNTYGFALNLEDTFVKQLERQINSGVGLETSVINGGVPGYNVWQEDKVVRRYFDKIKPSMVIMAMYVNDIESVHRPIKGGQSVFRLPFYPGENWEIADSNWINERRLFLPVILLHACFLATNKDIDPLLQIYKDINKKFHADPSDLELQKELEEYYALYDGALRDNFSYLSSDEEKVRGRWEKGWAQLLETGQWLESHGCSFLVVLLPYRNQVEPPRAGDRIQQETLEFCKNHEIGFLDMLPIFRMHSDKKIYLPFDYHPSSKGNQIIAESIYDYLEQNYYKCYMCGEYFEDHPFINPNTNRQECYSCFTESYNY